MPAGRRKQPTTSAAIVAAALGLLRRRGYDGLVLDEVARLAGVGKSSLYSRFRDRGELAVAALASLQREPPGVTGDLRFDLIALLGSIDRDLGAAGISVLGAVLACPPADLSERRAAVFAPFSGQARRLLAAAGTRGLLRSDVDVDAVVRILLGALLAKVLIGEVGETGWAERTVDALLDGLTAGR